MASALRVTFTNFGELVLLECYLGSWMSLDAVQILEKF
jgi:hypothetical protein